MIICRCGAPESRAGAPIRRRPIPSGDDGDVTRDPGYHDRTYEYLRGTGILELACPEAAGR